MWWSFFISSFVRTILSTWSLDVTLPFSISPLLGCLRSHTRCFFLLILTDLNQPVYIIFKLLM